MKHLHIIKILSIFALLTAALSPIYPSGIARAASACAASSPSSGAYTVTVCLTTPADGSTLTGASAVNATVSISGKTGVQRVVFYLNGDYLLTDYQSPYTFNLPTGRWVDGPYLLEVEALMRDGFTSRRAGGTVTFNNNVSKPPVNNRSFTPATGTQPRDGDPFVVLAAGDGAGGETNADRVVSLIAGANPNLFLYLGDVYEKGSVAEFYNWYGVNGASFSRFRAITNPTIGNHEYENGAAPGYFDYWDNVPNYYSFNAGIWHFISLNSNSNIIAVASGSPQYNWLANDLAANPNACTIVYYHHPLFNVGSESPETDMADIWALMARYHVTMVLNGHDHEYQRWVALDGNGSPNPGGITEFVAGGGGHGVQTITRTDSRLAYSNDDNPTALGALKLSLTPGLAQFEYLSVTGSVLDAGTIPCSKPQADIQPPSPPTVLSAKADLTKVDLSWQAALDNYAIGGYTIYRNGALLVTLSGKGNSYRDTTVKSMTTYTYRIDAFDKVGNHSALSNPLVTQTDDATIYLPLIK